VTSACGRGWRVVARSHDLSRPCKRPPGSTFCRFRHLRSGSENLLNIDFGLSQPRMRWPPRRRLGVRGESQHNSGGSKRLCPKCSLMSQVLMSQVLMQAAWCSATGVSIGIAACSPIRGTKRERRGVPQSFTALHPGVQFTSGHNHPPPSY
jgi:hypothetical protein